MYLLILFNVLFIHLLFNIINVYLLLSVETSMDFRNFRNGRLTQLIDRDWIFQTLPEFDLQDQESISQRDRKKRIH